MLLAMGFDKEDNDVGVTICSINPQDSHFNCLLLPNISSNSCCILQVNKTDNDPIKHGLVLPIAYHSIFFLLENYSSFIDGLILQEGAIITVLVNCKY